MTHLHHKKPLNIGLDFDGVIADCGKLKSDIALELYGVTISASDFKRELVVGNNILTDSQYTELQNKIYGTREYGFRIEPVTDAFTSIQKLKELGHRVQVITSRSEQNLNIAQEWLHNHNIDLPFTGVSGSNKAQACIGLDIFVDDDFDKLEPLIPVVPQLFLLNWDYNKHITAYAPIQRVNSWKEFYAAITDTKTAI